MEAASHWILLVEDNEDEAQMALRALRRSGAEAEIRVARDGDEAIQMLSAGPVSPPSAAFLDIKLPGISGLEVLAWMRNQDAYRHVPTVVFVGMSDGPMLRRALDLGANSLIRKEVDYDLYMDKVGMAFRYWLDVNVHP